MILFRLLLLSNDHLSSHLRCFPFKHFSALCWCVKGRCCFSSRCFLLKCCISVWTCFSLVMLLRLLHSMEEEFFCATFEFTCDTFLCCFNELQNEKLFNCASFCCIFIVFEMVFFVLNYRFDCLSELFGIEKCCVFVNQFSVWQRVPLLVP